jgi:pyrroloquinoline quinone biosynthesis protein E
MRAQGILSVARARLFAMPIPVAVGFELTHLCNLSCGYCDRHRPMAHEMTLDQILGALDGLKRLGMCEISLDGGEALAHRDIDAISEWLDKKGTVTRLNSNGILIPRRMNVVKRCAKVKISLDGPESVHDAARGPGAYHRAINGALVSRELGVPVEFTCVLGRHNANAVDALMDIANRLEIGVVFQPARDSLFFDGRADRSQYRLTTLELRRALLSVEHHKRIGSRVANHWSSLRHFRSFPKDTALPCAAGWINLTMDPEGTLYHCGQTSRADRSCNVVELGAEAAFAKLKRAGCSQCWCARVVEENFAWGGRFDRFLPLSDAPTVPPPPINVGPPKRRLPLVESTGPAVQRG